MIENYQAWDLEQAVSFYSLQRNKAEDIYESERVFFFPLMRMVSSVLDVGCGAGGIWNIIRSLNPKIKYTGLDVSQKMIDCAQRRFPETSFKLTSGSKIDMPDDAFDAVISLGVIHHVPDYPTFIRECYRVCKKYCLLDLPRLVATEHKFNIQNSYMLLKERFSGNSVVTVQQTKVPYVLADAASVFNFLLKDLQPEQILAKGYFGRYHNSVTLPVEKVCFTVVCIEKAKNGRGEIVADLPREILERLRASGIDVSEPFERLMQ